MPQVKTKTVAARFAGNVSYAMALLSVALMCVVSARSNAETLNIVMQPVFTPERAKEVYKPLVDYLNQSTPHTFNLVTPKNFHYYWADMRRRDDYHIVFDDAHLTDYRIQKLGYEPLVKTAEPTQFTLLAGYGLDEISMRAVIARRVVTMPAPSMGFAILTDWYDNPMQQPIFVSSALSWADTVEIVFAGEADAAMVPTWLADRYPNLEPINASDEFPGAAFSAAPGVSDTVKADITEALLSLHEDDSLYEVLVEMNVSQFLPATAEEYSGLGEMLSTFYGY